MGRVGTCAGPRAAAQEGCWAPGSAPWHSGQRIPATRPPSSLTTVHAANCGRFDGGTGRPQFEHLDRSGGTLMRRI